MSEIIPPKYCPDCGGTNIKYVELWHRSQWECEPSNPDWHPFEGTSYDVWCEECKTSFDIFPNRHLGHYWYDEHPEDVPEEGNKHWNKILAQRNPPPERCGNCIYKRRFKKEAGFCNATSEKLFRFGSYCGFAQSEDEAWEKQDLVWYWETCRHTPSKWTPNSEFEVKGEKQ